MSLFSISVSLSVNSLIVFSSEVSAFPVGKTDAPLLVCVKTDCMTSVDFGCLYCIACQVDFKLGGLLLDATGGSN